MKLLSTFQVLTCMLLLFCTLHLQAQVTIGTNTSPVEGTLLDVKENDNAGSNSTKGIIFPRVALEKLNSLTPCVKPEELQSGDEKAHTALLVYNVTNDPGEGLCPGIYVWDGSIWTRVQEECSYPIDDELINTPNCYIVAPGSTSEAIPVGKPYLVFKMRPDLEEISLSDKVSVHLLWQDTQGLITNVALTDGDKGGFSKFQVQAAPSKTGNALVAVHIGANGDETDPIRWSWHIWVTDYNPDTNANGTTYVHNSGGGTYTFMDRNLGAYSVNIEDVDAMGLMYQWGRKDPFTSGQKYHVNPDPKLLYDFQNNLLTEQNEYDFSGVSGTGIKHVLIAEGTSSNLHNSIINPTTFYYGKYKYIKDSRGDDVMAPFDWFTSDDTGASSDDNLWGTSSGKSPFDPCPKGWRVPDYKGNKSPWNKFHATGWTPPTNIQRVGSGDGSGNQLNADSFEGVSELGFYPYGLDRRPRYFNKPGNMGAGGALITGGLFNRNIFSDEPYSYYWTALPKAGEPNATVELIGWEGFNGAFVQSGGVSRATGAFVRCVKE